MLSSRPDMSVKERGLKVGMVCAWKSKNAQPSVEEAQGSVRATSGVRTAKDRLASLLSSAHYKKRAVIAIDADAEQVSIIAMFYGGQDYETILQGL